MRGWKKIVVDWAEDVAARRGQAREFGRMQATRQVEIVLSDYEHGPTEEETDPRTHCFRDEAKWQQLALSAADRNGVPADLRWYFVSSYVERAVDYYALRREGLRRNQQTLYGDENILANELGRFLLGLPAEARVLTYRGARLVGEEVSFIENDEEPLS